VSRSGNNVPLLKLVASDVSQASVLSPSFERLTRSIAPTRQDIDIARSQHFFERLLQGCLDIQIDSTPAVHDQIAEQVSSRCSIFRVYTTVEGRDLLAIGGLNEGRHVIVII
jgi:hypothetical protein